MFNFSGTLISADNTWLLWAVCTGCAALAIILEQKFAWAAKVTGCVLALLFAILLSNLKIIPTDSAVYDTIWSYVVPLSIPLLLMRCDLVKVGRDAGKLLIIFLIGSVGTVCGSFLSFYIFRNMFNGDLGKIAGAFTGTYIGGSLNMAALAGSLNIPSHLVSAATVADNILMCIYFFVLMAIPAMGFFKNHYKQSAASSGKSGSKGAAGFWKSKNISIRDIGLCAFIAFGIVALAQFLSGFMGGIIPDGNMFMQIIKALISNLYFWITTISVVFATVFARTLSNLPGSMEIGTYFIHLFFFVIGAPASFELIIRNSPILFAFAAVIILVNMIFCLVFGKLFGFNIEEIVLASNANIGGPTTAAAMAVSKGWHNLVGPVMLVGTIGYCIGTYCGILVGTVLGL